MSKAELDPVLDRVKEEFIIDADIHLQPELEDLLPYVHDGRIKEKLEIGGFPPAVINWTPPYATNEGGSGLDAHGRARTGEDILEAIDQTAVDMPLVTPGLSRIANMQNPRMKEGICRAYNDYLLEEVTNVADNIKGMAMVPQWSPDAVVEELDRIGSEGDIVAAYGWIGPYRLLGDPEYDPVFEKLVSLDLPWALHAGGQWPRSDVTGQSLRSWNEYFGFNPSIYAMTNTINMILTGVFDKFPDLKIVYQEVGTNWIPFVAYRLDEFYQDHPEDVQLTERMFDDNQRYLDKLPSEYIYDNFRCATQPISLPDNSRLQKALFDMCQAEKTFVFSSDWPHHTFDVPNWVYKSAVDDELRSRILQENARETFRI